MPALSAQGLRKEFARGRRRCAALDDASLFAAEGSTLVVLGASGAGKSTLLRVLAGLERPDSGKVTIGALDVTSIAAEDRRIALVLQDDGLFPHMRVDANLAFSPRLPIGGRAEKMRAVTRALEIEALLRAKPRQLSGGERQRVALARAILSDPDVLLLDEPLAHLDPPLRARIRLQLAALRDSFRGPIVYVTHDHAEALTLGDRVAVLIQGKIEQCDRPERVYESPATMDVARFFGNPGMNIVPDASRCIGVRAENVRIDAASDRRSYVRRYEWMGADAYVFCEAPWGEIIARVSSAAPQLTVGEEVGLSFAPGSERYFDSRTGRALHP